jgi:hypothetical protein
VGCKPPAALPSVGSAAPRIADTGPPVTQAEAEEYGRKLEKAFADGDADSLATLLRVDDLCRRAFSDFNLSADNQKGLDDAIQKRRLGSLMCRQWVDQLKGAKVLRVRERDGRRTVLLRTYEENQGLNYLEFTLARAADGRPATEDVYVFMIGETFTQALRRLMLAYLPVRGNADKSQLFLDSQPRLKQLRDGILSGDLAAAKTAYQSLPAELRDEKSIHIQGLRALQKDEPEYLAELERYRKLHPKDPSLDLVLVDYYVLKKDSTEVRNCLQRLDEAVGGDPMLRVIDASYRFELGERKEARRLAEGVLADDDKLAPAYWVIINSALADADHPEVLRRLKGVAEKCGVELDADGLKENDDYKEFVKSKEFGELKTWLAKRQK